MYIDDNDVLNLNTLLAVKTTVVDTALYISAQTILVAFRGYRGLNLFIIS